MPKNIEEIYVEFTEPVKPDSFTFKLGSNEIVPEGLISHDELFGTDFDDLHPIRAIIGLQDKLDEIYKAIYSSKKNHADYYLWEDKNITEEYRTNRFVTIHSDTNTISLCTSKDEIFGITVDDAAYIGGHSVESNDSKYGLVMQNGVGIVQCETPVVDGDHVVSNNYGIATKTHNNYGCKVITSYELDGITYAVIVIGAMTSQIFNISNDMSTVNNRVAKVEKNINVAMSLANEAHNKATNIDKTASDSNQKVDDMKAEMDAVLGDVTNQVESANKQSATAMATAEAAKSNAIAMQETAVKTANEAATNVNNLIADLEPITSWKDTESGNSGADYMVNYIKNGVATKSEIATIETQTAHALSETEKTAFGLNSLVTSIDRYSVGEFSQAYGLTREQASSILKNGMIYIPTENHTETYGDFTQRFIRCYYYTWENDKWISSTSPLVTFSIYEPIGTETTKYWYVDGNTAPEGREPYALYVWDGEQWIKVNILDGNVTNRLTSMIRQTADEITAEIVNARGSAASLGARLEADKTVVESLASWSKGGSDTAFNIATIQQSASDAGASLALMVIDKDGNKVLNGASIILGTGEDDSYIKFDARRIDFSAEDFKINANKIDFVSDRFTMDADKIDFVGTATFLKPNDLGENGTTIIDGGRIKTGTLSADTIHGGTIDATNVTIKNLDADQITSGEITAKHINADGLKITNGTYSGTLSVGGTVASPNFKVDANGNVVMNGNINLNGSISWGNNDVLTGAADVYEILSENSRFGCFYGENGSLYINASYIQSGVIDADYIDVDGIITANNLLTKSGEFSGHLNVESGSRCNIFTTIYLNNTSTYFLSSHQSNLNNLTVTGVFDASGNSFTSSAYSISLGTANGNGSLNGTWKLNSAELTTSDQNAKNSIADIDSRYSILFDNLTPRIYKYNDGTSGRYHIGFIAQEVDEALQKAGISRQEFAGVCIDTSEDDVEYWALRYDEFIALNTREIQKLKAEIAELKAIIAGGEKV